MEKRPAEAENGDADGSAAKKAKKDPECGVLLFCGSTNWEAVSIFRFFHFRKWLVLSVFSFSKVVSGLSIFGSGQYFWFSHFRRRSVFLFFHFRRRSGLSVFPFSEAAVFSVFPYEEAVSIFGFSLH
jgi:hypothetical protein